MMKSSAPQPPATHSQPPLIITEVEALRSFGKPGLFGSDQSIIVRLPQLSPQESEALSSRVNGYRNECGCSLGAKGMAAGFLVTLAWLLASYGFFTSQFWWRAPLALLSAIACAGAGKSLGIFLARRRLRLELDQLG